MDERLPDGPLADGERRPQLPVAQVGGGGQQVAIHPGPVLVKALEQLDGVHAHPLRSGAARTSSLVRLMDFPLRHSASPAFARTFFLSPPLRPSPPRPCAAPLSGPVTAVPPSP